MYVYGASLFYVCCSDCVGVIDVICILVLSYMEYCIWYTGHDVSRIRFFALQVTTM